MKHLPYILEPSKETFGLLEQLLARCNNHLEAAPERLPTQDIECIAVSSLNLLQFQVSILSSSRSCLKLHFCFETVVSVVPTARNES